jgi:hypothetical protein
MTLAGALVGEPPPTRKGPACRIGRLSESEQASIADALARGWTATAISEKAQEQGLDLPSYTINRHFTIKRCRCDRGA